MLSAVGTSAVGNPFLARAGRSFAHRHCGGQRSTPASDALSLAQPETPPASNWFSERTSLAIRARSQVKVTEDGQTLATSQAKLRFRYDFEASDGTRIRIRAKLDLSYRQITDGEDGTQSTKLRVKAQVSVLQETVSTGVSPLLETPDLSEEAKAGITQAVELFHQAADAATSLFLDSDPLDGDGLIAGLVEAFNGLSTEIDSLPAPVPQAQEASPTDNAGEVLESAPPEPTAVDAVDAVDAEPIELVPPAEIESEPVESTPPQEVGQASEPPSEPASEPALDVASARVTLRLRVIQSFRSIVRAFDSDSGTTVAAQASLRMSAQLTARYSLSDPGLNDPTASAGQVDAKA